MLHMTSNKPAYCQHCIDKPPKHLVEVEAKRFWVCDKCIIEVRKRKQLPRVRGTRAPGKVFITEKKAKELT